MSSAEDVAGSSENSRCLSKWVEGEDVDKISGELAGASGRGRAQLESELRGWPASRSKVKNLVRQGVDPACRKQLWLTVSGASRKLNPSGGPSRYEETLRESFGDTIRDDLVCPQPFLPPNGCCWWLLSSAGKAAGCRILVALERNHPDIAFCPDLQPLAAILLHVLDDESECYEVLSSIVEADNTGPCSFLDQSQAAFSASQLSLGQVARQKAKSSYRWLKSGVAHQPEGSEENRPANDEEMMQALGQWMNWVLKWLPIVTLIRIMDCFLVEGKKVFYRVALGMMKLTHRGLGRQAVSQASLDLVKENSKSLTHTTLLQCAFKIRNLSWQLIQQCRQASRTVLASPRVVVADRNTILASPGTDGRAVAGGRVDSAVVKDGKLWSSVFEWLPARSQIKKPKRLFCTENDGYNLGTLYDRCGTEEPLLLLIRTTDQEVFGAFLPVSLETRLHGSKSFYYFGSGETFIFSLVPKVTCYRWAGLNENTAAESTDYFVAGDTTAFAVGGGGDGFGIWLDTSLDHGTSSKCTTFNNLPLASSSGGDFRVAAVEVFAFADE